MTENNQETPETKATSATDFLKSVLGTPQAEAAVQAAKDSAEAVAKQNIVLSAALAAFRNPETRKAVVDGVTQVAGDVARETGHQIAQSVADHLKQKPTSGPKQ